MQASNAYICGAHVRADGLTVRAGMTSILRGVSLRVPPGGMVGILGPSGSGKSTLLNVLSGALEPSKGRVRVDGGDVRDVLRSGGTTIGYVPQEDIVHQHLSVAKALGYAAQLRLPAHLGERQVRGHVDSVLQLLELRPRARARIRTLSGGERKRANIGVELVGRPRLLLLDEPGAGLDPALERKLMRLLRRLADDGRTVILATHVMGTLDVLDSVLVLSDGVVVFDGPLPDALRFFRASHPAGIYDRLRVVPPRVWRRQPYLRQQAARVS
ncbi:MAG: ABC transporter ATP-binding protein [Armatimonadota bacterium]